MAVPILAPLVWLLPFFKILTLGSIKFIGLGLGALIAPVTTANFLVSMSSSTPLKYASFRYEKGHFTKEQMDVVERANRLIVGSMETAEKRLTRPQAREFLKKIIVGTLVNMKQPVLGMFSSVGRSIKRIISKLFSSKGE